MSAESLDPLADFDPDERTTFSAIADRLIPAAHGMPSAAEVVNDDRLRFVLTARPDLVGPIRMALRAELGGDVGTRLDTLGRDDPAALGAVQLAVVAGYYTDRGVRELIEYPGQVAIEVRSWEYPAYLEEGLIDAVLARGPVWRDPATGQRAVAADAPRTYAERWSTDTTPPAGAQAPAGARTAEGGHDGDDRT